MMLEEAIERACADVGIVPPKARGYGKWLQTDTLSGRNGKGDGRLIVNAAHVTAWNWQTGETITVGLGEQLDIADRRKITRQIEDAKRKHVKDAERAAGIASKLVATARLATHDYFAAKGFQHEKALVIAANDVRAIAGDYLVPDGARRAIVMPARLGAKVPSVQLIWESGAKKFLFGGEIEGAAHRIASGADTWLCEGFATGLSLRQALRGFGRADTILCCFSASNVAAVARSIRGRCFIATDNDKPLPQYGGLGTGEYFARRSGKPYAMPQTIGHDFNDMHMRGDIFAVQRLLAGFLKEATM